MDKMVLSTGLAGLDEALGVGGLPRGILVEMFGVAGAGKRAVVAGLAASVQAAGGKVAVVHSGHDCALLASGIIDQGSALVCVPETAEDAWGAALRFVVGRDLVVVDADYVIDPPTESWAIDHRSLAARIATSSMRQLCARAHASRAVVVIVSDRVDRTSSFEPAGAITTGLRFYASVRLKFTPDGARASVIRVVKNKAAPPFRWCGVCIGDGRATDAPVVNEQVAERIVATSKAASAVEEA